MIFQRHDIFRVRDEKKLIILDRGIDALGRDISVWKGEIIDNNLPIYAMVRRYCPDEDKRNIPVGISSHIRDEYGNRFRMFNYLEKEEVESKIDPYSLSKHINRVNESEKIKLLFMRLFDYAQLLNLQIGLYGSIAYDFLTGNKYINESSDLDLLLKTNDMSGITEIEKFYTYVCKEEKKSGIRVDCEIEFKSGNHISMKELLMSTTQTVLSKNIDDVTLLHKSEVMRFLNNEVSTSA